MRYEVANVAGNVTKMWGALSPQFLFGGTMDPLVPPTFLLHHLCASSTNMSGVIIMAFKVYCGFMLFNMIRLSRRGNLLTLLTLGPSPPPRERPMIGAFQHFLAGGVQGTCSLFQEFISYELHISYYNL